MSREINPIYKNVCPVCGGDADAYFLEKFGVCHKCATSINKQYSLNALELHHSSSLELDLFSSFFEEITRGLRPWGAQRTWAKRLIDGENTVIIAPTGMGKTTLLLVYVLYMHYYNGKNSIILAPTKSLARQIYNRITEYSERLGRKKPIILFYDSSKTKKKREKILEDITNGRFNILIATNHFLIRYCGILPRDHFDIIVIDDVDSLIRSSRNIVKLLRLLGYSDTIIELARKRNNLLWKLVVSKSLNNDELYRKLVEELISIEEEINKQLSSTTYKQVVIASATGRIKGTYGKVLRDLLRIDVSGITMYGRDLTDTYLPLGEDTIDTIMGLVEKIGKGGIILLSPRHPYKERLRTLLEKLIETLRANNIEVAEATPSTIKKLIEGEIDLIYGSSSYYGISVRGIDAPTTIKYIIFLGTPVFSIELSSYLASPKALLRALIQLKEHDDSRPWGEILNQLRRITFTMSNSELRLISMYMKGKISREELPDKIQKNLEYIETTYKLVVENMKKLLKKNSVVAMGSITLVHTGKDKYYAVIPDVMTYIQASGRASRLFLGHMTHGLSVIVEFDELRNIVDSLERRLQFYNREFTIRSLAKVDMDKEKKLIFESRKIYEDCAAKPVLKYKNILVIVESPTKAKTIANFFGKPSRRRIQNHYAYEIPFKEGDTIIHLNIIATKGHLYDLTTDPLAGNYGIIRSNDEVKPVYTTIKRCRICGYQFTHGDKCPRCGSSSFIDSKSVIDVLRKLAQEADEIYIATDPDIEGEKIAYDVYLALKGFNKNIWRIELHEITLSEFIKSLKNKRVINKKLVEAEIYRRSLDRLIGFSLSQHLWSVFGKHWLGAGRVQTPVLGWIVDRYNEYKQNKCFMVRIYTENGLVISKCYDLESRAHAREILKKKPEEIRIVVKDKYVKEIKPRPPLTTDELLYVAGRIGIPAKLVMKTAQELFESGLITYHRTSYHYISSTGISIAEKYLRNKGLDKYFHPNHWGTKGAHEAIRPIHPYDRVDLEKAVVEGLITPSIPLSWIHFRIYDIIFNRFIESQMTPYKVLYLKADAYLEEEHLGEIDVPVRIISPGANLISKPRIVELDTEKEIIIEKIREIRGRTTSRVSLHSEASIVMEMKNKGLGRPSTYATIINSIVRHGYVIRSKKKGFLIPTKTGISVYEFLSSSYPSLVSVDTTAYMESVIDEIASGRKDAYSAIMEVFSMIEEYRLPLTMPAEKALT